MPNITLVVGFSNTPDNERYFHHLIPHDHLRWCTIDDNVAHISRSSGSHLALLDFSDIDAKYLEWAHWTIEALGPDVTATAISDSTDQCGPAIAAGAHCFLVKSDPIGGQQRQVKAALRGELSLSPQATEALKAYCFRTLACSPHQHPRLSPRERELMDLVSAGQSVRAAAESLGVSYNTALTYIRRLYEKLGIRSKIELVQFKGKGEV